MDNYKIEYPDCVRDIVFVGNKLKNIRYGLELFLNNNAYKSALVILENPSKADESEGDKTICHFVLPVLNRLGYSKVIITNIIPFYSTDSKDICKDDDVLNNIDVYEYNKNYMEKCMDDSIDIFVGWGSDKNFPKEFYKDRIKSIEGIIKQTCYCSGINIDKTPKHPLYSWTKYINSLNDFKIYSKSIIG